MPTYLRPTTLTDALAALDGADLVILAGGTDFYPARVGKPLDEDVLDITAVGDLHGIEEGPDYWRIGALATWSELRDAELPAYFDALRMAAREIGGIQIQNAATICGNLCNASPAADGVPPLLALDAIVQLMSERGERNLRLGDFITGNRKTTRRPNELMTGILVPKPAPGTRSTFLKLGARKYLVISIAMVAVTIEPDESNSIAAARVALGACSPVAVRLPALEAALIGCDGTAALAEVVAAEHLAPIAPIDDVRGTAAYRRDAALTVIKRALTIVGAELGANS